ncbi:MAG: hypothetical protein WAX29_04320 [Propionibacterium sp.]
MATVSAAPAARADGEEPGRPRRYVACVRAADRPGSITAMAEVVSSRGVSIQSFATGCTRDGTAMITMLFATSERLERVIRRTLARLAIVEEVVVLPADDPRVLAVGVVHPAPGTRFLPPPDVTVTWSGGTRPDEPLLVDGQYLHVRRVIDAAIAADAVHANVALLPPGQHS